jgi:hypothetical protein
MTQIDKKKNIKIKKKRGMAAMLIVILVSVSAFIMAQNGAFLSIDELDSGYNYSKGGKAFSITDGCMESVISQIRLDVNYGIGVGIFYLDILDGQCEVEILDSGNDRTITVSGTLDNYTKTIEVGLTVVNRSITINNWEEKAN